MEGGWVQGGEEVEVWVGGGWREKGVEGEGRREEGGGGGGEEGGRVGGVVVLCMCKGWEVAVTELVCEGGTRSRRRKPRPCRGGVNVAVTYPMRRK